MADPVFEFVGANPFGLSEGSPTFIDIDDDEDLDALVGNYDGNTLFFRNIGTASNPFFAASVTNPFGLIDVGFSASPFLVDIDGDDDLDAFVGNYDGNTLFFRNTGTTSNALFAPPVINPFGLSNVGADAEPTFADIDSDGDWDVFVGNYNGNTLFFENTGTANNPLFAATITNSFGLNDV